MRVHPRADSRLRIATSHGPEMVRRVNHSFVEQERAALRANMKSRWLRLPDVIKLPEAAGLSVHQLLTFAWGISDAKARVILEDIGLNRQKKVRTLTTDETQALLAHSSLVNR